MRRVYFPSPYYVNLCCTTWCIKIIYLMQHLILYNAPLKPLGIKQCNIN